MQDHKDSGSSDHLSQESFSDVFQLSLSSPDEAITDTDIIPVLKKIEIILPNPRSREIRKKSSPPLSSESVSSTQYNALSTYNNYDVPQPVSFQCSSQASNSSMARPIVSDDSLRKPEKRSLRLVHPISTNWKGLFDFDVSITAVSKNWTYSFVRNKLYVKMGEACPINFSTNGNVPANTVIRLLPVYIDVTHCSNVVHRCLNHALHDSEKGVKFSNHLIHCVGDGFYEEDVTGRLSVVVPYLNPLNGHGSFMTLFRFLCFSSCVGGMNRRAIKVIFTLETNHVVVGQRTIEVKICSTPIRDCERDDKYDNRCQPVKTKQKKRRKVSGQNSDVSEFERGSKKPKTSTTDNGKSYTIMAKTLDEYKFLKYCQLLYILKEALRNQPSDALKHLNSLISIKKE